MPDTVSSDVIHQHIAQVYQYSLEFIYSNTKLGPMAIPMSSRRSTVALPYRMAPMAAGHWWKSTIRTMRRYAAIRSSPILMAPALSSRIR
jgi:hypothetical protein